ncbi:MAG: nucleotidyltransferase domain-containing protein [Patescibacteria group bacterium]
MFQPDEQSIITAVKQILPDFPVVFAYLFGSCARDDQGPLSDIDLALFFDDSVSKDDYRTICFDIEDAVFKTLELVGERQIQIQILNDLWEKSIALEREIVYDGELIYIKDNAMRAHYEAGAIHRWCDWAPRQERFNKATLASLDKPIEPYKHYAQ